MISNDIAECDSLFNPSISIHNNRGHSLFRIYMLAHSVSVYGCVHECV